MTGEELKSADTRSLISALQYCGRDSYYATYYDEVVDEITKRLDKIAELEKENAELKEKYAKNITDCDICDTYCNSQLTKAKELLKKVLNLKKVVTKAEEYLLLEEAEQFLKETK